MWLVIAEPDDHAALWAYLGLEQRGVSPLEIVTTDELVTASGWRHHLDGSRVDTRVRLDDERVLDGASLRGVLNRAVEPRAPVNGGAADFAQQEVRALLVSWLASLRCPVINPSTASCLCGTSLDSFGWRLRARACGLAIEPGTVGDDPPHAEELTTVLVTHDVIHGELAAADRDGLLALAAAVDVPVLQAWFRPGSPRDRFVTASPLAELRLGGAEGLAQLQRGLEGAWAR